MDLQVLLKPYLYDSLPCCTIIVVFFQLTEYITLRWNPMHVASIRWFVSNTKDPVVRGSTSTRSGTVIGKLLKLFSFFKFEL